MRDGTLLGNVLRFTAWKRSAIKPSQSLHGLRSHPPTYLDRFFWKPGFLLVRSFVSEWERQTETTVQSVRYNVWWGIQSQILNYGWAHSSFSEERVLCTPDRASLRARLLSLSILGYGVGEDGLHRSRRQGRDGFSSIRLSQRLCVWNCHLCVSGNASHSVPVHSWFSVWCSFHRCSAELYQICNWPQLSGAVRRANELNTLILFGRNF